MIHLVDEVCHDHGVDLRKLSREWDPRWAIEREQAAGRAFGPFHRQWLTEHARDPNAVRKILERMAAAKRRGLDRLQASKQGFTAADYMDFPGANLRAAINTTTTETNLWDPGLFAPLPVGEIRVGRAWSCDFGGVHGTTATPAISFRTRIGTNNAVPPTGVDLGVGPTMTLGTFTAQPWIGRGVWGSRIKGVAASGGTMTGNGFVICAGAAAATTVGTLVFGGLVVATIDDTIAQGIGVSVIWGTNNVANTITPQWLMYRSLN